MTGQELADAAFGLAVAVHGSDVEVAEAGAVRRFEHAERLAAAEQSHDAGASEAEPGRGSF
jgi:hypothetical protein